MTLRALFLRVVWLPQESAWLSWVKHSYIFFQNQHKNDHNRTVRTTAIKT